MSHQHICEGQFPCRVCQVERDRRARALREAMERPTYVPPFVPPGQPELGEIRDLLREILRRLPAPPDE